jgi:hypothetical protein
VCVHGAEAPQRSCYVAVSIVPLPYRGHDEQADSVS